MRTAPEIELHRNGAALVADPGKTPVPGTVQFSRLGERPLRHCTCKASKRKTCKHLTLLATTTTAFDQALEGVSWPDYFAATLWCQLAHLLHQAGPQPYATARVARVLVDGHRAIRITAAGGDLLASVLDTSPARIRFLERMGKAPDGFANRALLLERLARYQWSDDERRMVDAGMPTRRQAWEDSVWHRLAYHHVREHGDSGRFTPAIDQQTGDFTLSFHRVVETNANTDVSGDGSADADTAANTPADAAFDPERPLVRVVVPRPRVEAALRLLAETFPDQHDLQIHPVPLRSLFLITPETELDLAVRPVIETLQASGEKRYIARDTLARFRYGNLIYLPELKLLAEIERPGRERRFKPPQRMQLERSQVPGFLAKHAEAVAEGHLVLDEPLRDLEIVRAFDRLEITPDTVERGWFWLSVRYGAGNLSVSLADVLRAMAQGLPYLETDRGWIDLEAPAFDGLRALLRTPPRESSATSRDQDTSDRVDGDRVRLSAREVLQLQATSDQTVAVVGDADTRPLIERLLTLVPATPYRQPEGLASTLRPYQERGVDWLRWLWENRLAGLLCDDMGLGKTHQAMALMTSIAEHDGVADPFLVVCPTSVIDHWHTKIKAYAPGLDAVVYHGSGRYLPTIRRPPGKVWITSYGVLRRDAERLATVSFAVAVLDEIQHLKNRATKAYRAALHLNASLTIGLTGTPVENQLGDLKGLFDLLLPGLLGTDEQFRDRYGDTEHIADRDQMAPLRRRVAPFILRRRKETVLDDLPPKVEDLYTCALSDDQVKLYRDAVDERAGPLVERLRNRDEPAPYIHIFALLDLLKQVCNHPALALKAVDRAADYRSGKWDLFRELLGQALESQQKVVVFTQYLGMITLMQHHLEALKVPHEVLTGATTNRGARVERFNTDPACRVFLGSLKAGGTGIDLIGGSVVIHYDRWWNAAREDQATDRVHRMGQTRSVQVIKLVTDGTLEEKIAAIIDRKRALLANVVEDDDPALSKAFSRSQLLALLKPI